MTDRIEHPTFFEGQILGAHDLTAGLEYERGQLARHERYLHLWGIASGLELKKQQRKDPSGNDYVEVTVTAGVAIDGTGREIVVPAEDEVSSADFENELVALESDESGVTWYPVFIYGHDEAAPAAPLLPTGCNGGSSTRARDQYRISFGRMSMVGDLEIQRQAEIGEGPRIGTRDAWKVLLGFVTWDTGLKRFKDVAAQRGANSRRYAGVQADSVAARAGTLTLQTQTTSTPGKPAVVLSEEKGGMLKFGHLDAAGDVPTPAFAVDVTGRITGSLATGATLVESGIGVDGMLLPLPPGVTPAQVASGDAIVHAIVTPRVNDSTPPDTTHAWGAFPLESYVDEDGRIHSLLRWYPITPAGGTPQDRPASCEYLVIAATRAR